MADGLPWVRISSEIAFDNDLELVSSDAFRTYIEIIALSGYHLLDGRVPLRMVRKLCNAPNINEALAELSSGEKPFLVIDNDMVIVRAYDKWQETAEQIQRRREADAARKKQKRKQGDSDVSCDTDPDSPPDIPPDVLPDSPPDSGPDLSTEYRVQSKSTEKDLKTYPTGRDSAPTLPENPQKANELVACYVDYHAELGRTKPDRRRVGQVAKAIGEQLALGAKPHMLQAAVKRLVDVGLWEVVDGGYLIHDYLDYQASKKQVEEERGRARERMANVRKNKKRSSGEVQANNKRSSGEVRVTPHPHKDLLSSSPDGVHLELHSEFDSFWSAYPRKEGKGQAKRAWAGALRKAPPDVVMAGLTTQLPSLAARERQYIPLPATWLNGERWGDEVTGNGKAPPSDPATWSLRKVFAMHFFENHVWMCCELNPDEEREIREGIESGRITREEVETWQ